MKIKIIFSILFLSTNFLFAQEKIANYYYDPNIQPVEQIIDITNLRAELKIDPYNRTVDGIVYYNFNKFKSQVDSIVFDIPDIEIISTELNKDSINFKIRNQKLIFYTTGNNLLNENNILKINYIAKPQKGLYFVGWDDETNRMRKNIWAHNPAHWIPYVDCKQDILKSELIVTFDKNYKVYSNGERMSVIDNEDETRTWHYKLDKPHVVYLLNLIIGDYEFIEKKYLNKIPIELWYYSEQENLVETTYKYSEEMFEYFKRTFNFEYPYSLYRQVSIADYLFGAMETTTATMFGDFFVVDERASLDRNYINTNAHELAHQWFGNCVSHLNNRHVWLTEGFATFFAKQFEKELFGEKQYQYVRHLEMLETFEAEENNDKPILHSSAGSPKWYYKSSLVLDMLKYVMGDEEFYKAINYYLNKHKFAVVENKDFVTAIEEATGKSYDWFFEQWIYKPGYPIYQVWYKEFNNPNRISEIHIYVKQVQEKNSFVGLFKMPIVIQVFYSDGSFEENKVFIEEEFTDIVFENPDGKQISFILFDPNREILKKVAFVKSFEELFNQATNAPNMIDRFDAIQQFRVYPIETKRDFLCDRFSKESYHLIKNEIIYQLSADTNNVKTIELFKEAIKDIDSKVRQTTLQVLKQIPKSLKNDVEILLKDSSYVTMELALDNLSKSFAKETKKYLSITKDEIGWWGKNIRVKWLEIAIADGQNEHLFELLDYLTESFDFQTRINALNSIKNLHILTEEILEKIFNCYFYWHTKVSRKAEEVIKEFVKSEENKIIIKNYINNLKSEERKKLLKLLN